MANRRPPYNQRRMDYGRNDRGPKNFDRVGVSPWQGGGPGAGISNLLPLGGGGSTEATLTLANNLISNLLQSRQQTVPSLLDMPIRRDFGPELGRFDRSYSGQNRMGNQGNFRRSGNYNRSGDRMNNHSFKPRDGPRNQNRTTPKKEADFKPKPVKESTSDVKAEEAPATTNDAPQKATDSKKDVLKSRFDDVHSEFLKCHICNKSMWDGRSFENHLGGRAHAIMMQKTAESYALTADTMRQQFKIREMTRTRKSGHQRSRDFYCAMCDLYAANGAAHRTTVGHRRLKKFLHPTCTSCRKEMPTRIELDEHRLTLEHLKNIHDKQEGFSKEKPEMLMISTLAMEQSYVREDRRRRRPQTDGEGATDEGKPAEKSEGEPAEKGEGEPADKIEGGEQGAEVKIEPTDDSAAKAEDSLIVDYIEGDDLADITAEMLPVYSTERSVGRSFLSEFRCVQCRLCRKLLDSQETAEVHLRTWRHHRLFVRMLREKSGHLGVESNKRPLDVKQEPSESEVEVKRRRTDSESEQNGDGDDDKDEIEEGDEMPSEDWDQNLDDANVEDEQANQENGEFYEENQEEAAATDDAAAEEPVKEKTPPPAEPEPEPEPAPAPKPSTRGTPARRGARGRPRRN